MKCPKVLTLVILTSVATLWIVTNNASSSSLERGFYAELERLPIQTKASLTQFKSLSAYQAVCILTPYSADDPVSLNRMFDNISYASWKKEILNKYANGGDGPPLGFYLVTNNAVAASVTHIKLAVPQRFSPGCYKLNELCVGKDPHKNSPWFYLNKCSL